MQFVWRHDNELKNHLNIQLAESMGISMECSQLPGACKYLATIRYIPVCCSNLVFPSSCDSAKFESEHLPKKFFEMSYNCCVSNGNVSFSFNKRHFLEFPKKKQHEKKMLSRIHIDRDLYHTVKIFLVPLGGIAMKGMYCQAKRGNWFLQQLMIATNGLDIPETQVLLGLKRRTRTPVSC